LIRKNLEKSSEKFFSRTLLKRYLSSCFVLLLFLSFASCTDQGCIEADDFGEYQTQTLEIESNAAAESCNYDPSLSLSDASQGSGIKACLTSGSVSVTDSGNVTQTTSSGGCNGKQSDGVTPLDASHLNLCVNSCVQSCVAGSSSAGGANPEPNWKSTDQRDSTQNAGVQILPGSKIIITATGSVTLSNSANYQNIYIPVDGLLENGMAPNYKTSDWSTASIFDVTKGQELNLSFNGHWSRPSIGVSKGYYNTADIGGGTAALSPNSAWNSAIYDGAISLVAYTIPQPSGYLFDYSKSYEVLGTKGTPLLPDPRTWTCDYNSEKIYNKNDTSTLINLLDSNCYLKSDGYASLGYSPSVDIAVSSNSSFAITSSSASNSLGYYGGPIRWLGDGVDSPSSNAKNFYNTLTVSKNTTSISAGASVASDGTKAPQSQVVTIPVGGLSVINNDSIPYMVFLGANNTNCVGANIAIKIIDSDGDVLTNNTSIETPESGWGLSSGYPKVSRLTVAPGQTITLTPPALCGSATYGNGNNSVNAKFIAYKDITLTQSGFIRFTTLNATSGTCTLNGRIINPQNSETSSDFYEYDNFNSLSSVDPLDSLSVPSSGLTSLNWSKKVFVRKGQKIRLSPISWNGVVSVNSTSGSSIYRQCGIGMVMKVVPRPALICKGIATEIINNPNPSCLQDFKAGDATLIGCQAYATECSDSSNTANYCPYDACKSTITCTDGTSDNNYTKTNCTKTSNVNSSACNTALSALSATSKNSFKISCGDNYCSDKMNTNAQISAKIGQQLAQCYDLENYTGRVQDIPIAQGSIIDSSNAMFSKGAVKLANFNGFYGNFSNFKDTGKVDSTSNNNRIYQSSNISFSQNGRLKFLFLTNNKDFRDLDQNYSASQDLTSSYPYSSLSSRGSYYNGNNGFKISFDGTLQFSNGQWLEAKLCKETNSHSCRSLAISTDTASIEAQPKLVLLNDPATSGTNPVLSNSANYQFDAYGTLTRVTAPGAKDCSASSQGIDTEINSTYYCHTYLNSTSSYIYDSSKTTPFSSSDYDELNTLRLTFKIKDPETTNCIIPGSGSVTNNGIKLTNPAYQAGSGNDSATCKASDGPTSLTASNPCTKQYYCTSVYANNSGKYYVTVKVTNPPGSNISNIIGGVITPVIETMDGKHTVAADGTITKTVGQSERIYTLVVGDSRYQAILSMSLALMIMFYGVTYLMGISELNSSELINRCIKIALIYFFSSPTGWYWFNLFVVKWFKDGTDYLAFMMASSFDDSAELAKAISLNDYYDKSVLFSGVDKVFGLFFSQAVQKKISALLFASIFGFVYLWIIYLSFMLYVYAVGNAILYYLTAQIFISILFTLGPIFFIFTLFNQTKGMFDSWLNQLIGFSLQQILLLTTLSFFNMMMYEVLKMSLGYKICWDEVWTINIITRVTLLSFWTPASLPPRLNTQTDVGNIGHPEGIPSLFSILFIWVIASLMKSFITFMTDLGASIGGSLKASEMGKGLGDAIAGMQKYSSERFNDLTKATIGEPIKRLDAALFDSGEHADKARKERQDKNRKDQGLKESLNKAGNEAMSKFKRENALAYSKMSESEKKEALLSAKEQGIKKQADKLGISDKELKRLKSDKGLKYEGSNLLVAAAQAARQKAGFGGGTLSKSLNDSKIDTKMSFSEAKEGMSKMSKEERADFLKRADNKEVAIGKSTSQKVIGAAKTAVSPATGTLKGLSGVGGDLRRVVSSGGKDLSFSATSKNISDTKSALGAAKDSVKKAAGKAANFAGFNEYDKATKQLEASGTINRMASGSIVGTNWARPEKEKQLIRQQIRKNREEAKAALPKGTDGMTMAKLKSLDKGLTQDEKNPGVLTSMSSATFGAGGLSRAAAAQFEKTGTLTKNSATESKVSGTTSSTKAISSELAQAQTQKASLTQVAETAKKVSSNISEMKKLEAQEKTATTPEAKAAIEAKKSDLKEKDKIENGGTGYFQVQELREKQNAEKDAVTRKSLGDQIENITKQPGYVELGGSDGKSDLNKVNATYQKASQGVANLDKKIDKLTVADKAASSSAATYDKVVNSPAAQKTQDDYSKISTFHKATNGVFAGTEVNKTLQDHKKLESFKKDYGKLDNPKDKDLELKTKDADGNKSSKAADRHNDFAEKYKDFKIDPPAQAPAQNPNQNATVKQPDA